MMKRVLPEVMRAPVMQEVIAPELAHWGRVRAVLATGWTTEPARQARVAAAVGHAISFGTWQSLVREQGLGEGQAVAMMVTLVRCLASGHQGRSS